MHILQRAAVGLLSSLLPLLLFATVLDFGIVTTVGQPDKVKQVLADSGIYDNIIPAALKQASDTSKKNSNVSLVDPTVQAVANEAFSPQFLRQSTENIIDGTYHWLDGKVTQPDFRIDLSSKKTAFAVLVADHAKDVASKLPPCSLYTPLPDPNKFDVFKASCMPTGVTPNLVAADVKQELLANKDFLKDPVITANSLKSKDSNQSIFDEQLKSAPTAYQWAKRSPLILTFLTILSATGIVLLSATRNRGLRRVAITLLVVGVLMMVFAWGLNYGVTKQALPRLDTVNGGNIVLQNGLKSLVTDLTQAVDRNYWLFGGIYSALGALAIGVPIFIHKQHKGSVAVNTASESVVTGQKPAPTKSRK